jgi:hypothetical protein
MPDGSFFTVWADETTYTRAYHVSAEHPAACDDNPGTPELPLRSIGAAARLLQPGEKAVIHDGIYRERVEPANGGTGPDAMIAYEAAPGARPIVRGSEVWPSAEGRFRPSDTPLTREPRLFDGIHRHGRVAEGVAIWMGDLPMARFAGYNPFSINNTSGLLLAYGHKWRPEEIYQYLLKRGMVFVDGMPLTQVRQERELTEGDGRFWVDTDGRRLHFRLPGDADPCSVALEITVREQVFAPRERELAYIRVSGLAFEHAANSIPALTLQHGALSCTGGHHWIIEDCAVRHANGAGIDVGAQGGRYSDTPEQGGHLIRRNTISHCGITGLCGFGHVRDVLVEENVFEYIGGLKLERMFECAALKFHGCHHVLIRGNVFRHLTQAVGIWLDYLCGHNRVSGNVFTDIDSLFGGVHLESSFEPQWVDGNLFWDIRSWRIGEFPEPLSPMRGGHGVFCDSSDLITVAHNLFGKTASFPVAFHFKQADRIVHGRTGLNRRHAVRGNVFATRGNAILFGRAEENTSDGNVFDRHVNLAAFCIYRPEPHAVLDLGAWREYFGHDRQSRLGAVVVDIAPLTWSLDGELPPAVEPWEEYTHAGPDLGYLAGVMRGDGGDVVGG